MRAWENGDIEIYELSDDGSIDASSNVDEAVRLIEEGPLSEDRIKGVQMLATAGVRYDLVAMSARSKSARIRSAAALGLGAYPQNVDLVLLKNLMIDTNPHVRSGSVASAGHLLAYELFTDALALAGENESNIHVRCAAIVAAARLARTEDQIEQVAELTVLDSGPVAFRDSSIAALRILGDPESIDELREAFDQALDNPPGERLAAQLAKSLGAHYDPTVDEERFLRAIQHLPGARTPAMRVFVNHPSEAVRPTLEFTLTSDNPRLAGLAARALTRLGLQGSSEAVSELLLQGSILHPRTVLRTLCDSPDGLSIIVRATQSNDPHTKAEALRSLDYLAPEQMRSVADEVSQHPNPVLRRQAELIVARSSDNLASTVMTVGILGDGRDADALHQALESAGHRSSINPADISTCDVVVLLEARRVDDARNSGAVVVDATKDSGDRILNEVGPRSVKALNIPPATTLPAVDSRIMRPFAPVAGRDQDAVEIVETILVDLGCQPLWVGGPEEAVHLDAVAQYTSMLPFEANPRTGGVIGFSSAS